MHILWVPSWYPSAISPLNGSFFAEQKAMLERGGHRCGIGVVDGAPIWQMSLPAVTIDESNQVVRAQTRFIPRGVLPGDRHLISRAALRVASEYESYFGIPEVIHAHSVFPGLIAAKAMATRWGIPFGLTEHRPSSLQRCKVSPRYQIIRAAVRECAFRYSVSTDIANKLSNYYGSDFGVATLPTTANFFEAAASRKTIGIAESITFLHVSHVDENKRVGLTIRALGRALDSAKRCHEGGQLPYPVYLRIIGVPESLRAELSAQAKSAGVSSNVILEPPADRTSILEAMQNADCFVLLSAVESGGVVFAEAQAAGLPCIASATSGGTYSVSADTGIIVPIDDEEATASAFIAMMERIKCGAVDSIAISHAAAQRFSERAFVDLHIGTYKRAMGINMKELS